MQPLVASNHQSCIRFHCTNNYPGCGCFLQVLCLTLQNKYLGQITRSFIVSLINDLVLNLLLSFKFIPPAVDKEAVLWGPGEAKERSSPSL